MRRARVESHDSCPTLNVVRGRAKPVFHGLNSTEPNLFHLEETTYKALGVSWDATLAHVILYVWPQDETKRRHLYFQVVVKVQTRVMRIPNGMAWHAHEEEARCCRCTSQTAENDIWIGLVREKERERI